MNSKRLGWLDDQLPGMTEDLIELASINSGSENVAGLQKAADWIEGWANFENASFHSLELPHRKVVTSQGDVERRPTGPLLRWDCRPEAPRRVLLCIHYDTVFGADHEFQSCRLDGDRLHGPGVADAKGGIVLLRYALQALERHASDKGAELQEFGWSVVLNPDEELGSPNSTSYLQSIAPDFDFGLLFEPSLPSGELVGQRKGSGNFDLVVRGRSAHAGRHFEDGRNAVAQLSRCLVQLDDLNGQRDGTTINIGQIQGGGAVNIVPDLAIGRFNVRVADFESLDWIRQNLDQIMARVNQADGFQVELFGDMTSPPKLVGAEQTNLMSALQSVVQDLESRKLSWKSTGGVCDGNKLAAAGLPNIDTLGPVGDGLHSSREWVQLSTIAEKAKWIASLLQRFAEGDFPELVRPR